MVWIRGIDRSQSAISPFAIGRALEAPTMKLRDRLIVGPVPGKLRSSWRKLKPPLYRFSCSPKGVSPSGCTVSETLMRSRYSVAGVKSVSARAGEAAAAAVRLSAIRRARNGLALM